jgi:hypothetical protein
MTESPKRVRVTQTHVTSDPNPVRFRAGDAIAVGHHDRLWTAYVWGTDQAGRAGWVPDDYLKPTGAHEAVALRDYDATELTVGAGEFLDVLDEAGGWYLCRTATGHSGWVPGNAVEPVEPDRHD